MVRKSKVAGLPLQVHLNKKAECSKKEPIHHFQPERLGQEMQWHCGKERELLGGGAQGHPGPSLLKASAPEELCWSFIF